MIRKELLKLPQLTPPPKLKAAIRSMASREQQAVVESHGSRWYRFWKPWRARFNELLRPFTIPATGGFVSSCVLFAFLALAIGQTTQAVAYEVPVIFADTTGANLVPMQLRSSVIVTFSLDGKGRITDYRVSDGADSFIGDATHLQAKNISIPEFPSVLALAQPINSDVSIRFTPLLFRP